MKDRPTIRCTNCGKLNRIGSAPQGVPRCGVCHHPLPWVIEADRESFDEELRASVPVLVDFWAPWCGPCRMVSPVVERLAADNAGRLKVVKLNVDEAPAISARYQIQGIPLLLVLRDGREVDRLTGAPPPEQLRQWIEGHLAEAAGAAGQPS
jgi:thioredoxin 2